MRVIARAFKIVIILTLMMLSGLTDWLGLRWLWWRLTGGGAKPTPMTLPALVRQAFEQMGPTFVKLGQVIASSPGLFPKSFCDEFARCLDRVEPITLDEVKGTIQAELGAPVETLFTDWDDQPLGSASIAQVHAATLRDGQRVVVKVQRSGIEEVVEADVWWMKRGARVLEALFKGARLANLSGVIQDFEATIYEELDFQKEASNLREFNSIMDRHAIDDVLAPIPVDALVTKRVLVMQRLYGFKADDVEGMTSANIDPETYLRKGLRAWLLTVVLHGFFHGDAHAGNLMMLPEGPACGFLDFGIIGRFDDAQRHQVIRYVLAFAAQDYEALADVMIQVGALDGAMDREPFVADLKRVYGPLLSKSVADIRYDELLPDATRVAYRYGITLPREFMLILKQLLFFDRYAKLAAPTLNVFSDYGLIDFLFTPTAMQCGLDFNQIMPLLQRIQAQNAQDQAGQRG